MNEKKSPNQQTRNLGGIELCNISCTEIGGAFAYVAVGGDPQLILSDSITGKAIALEPGRYRFFFQAHVTFGRIYRPRLYLNFGEGFSEQPKSNVFLEWDQADIWFGDIEADRRITAIRFDPSETNVRFTLIRMAIEDRSLFRPSLIGGICEALQAVLWWAPSEVKNWAIIRSASKFVSKAFCRQSNEYLRKRNTDRIAEIQLPEPHSQVARPSSQSDGFTAQYLTSFNIAAGAKDANYAPLTSVPVRLASDAPKIIAFYLPQFHPIPENDAWWGAGFTEWTNVSKAVPQFVGHYQPRLPAELGFYDLRLPEVMSRQIELAKLYGVSGFCFHYYWFDGKRLLERPIENFLAQKGEDYDFPFCLCWANENWTRRWDGADQDILMQQSHSIEDHKNVFADLLRYFVDPRYIRVDGKPVVTIYRPSIIPNIKEMVAIWRKEAEYAGLPGLYLVATTAFGFDSPEEIGFDALCQFPPHAVAVSEYNSEVDLLNSAYDGHVYDFSETVEAYIDVLTSRSKPDKTTAFFPGVMAGWDNEARKPGRGHVFHNATPEKFRHWLAAAYDWTEANNQVGRQFVFINAWNEWAEGTYLEPDRRFGYAYLTAVAAVRSRQLTSPDALNALCSKVNSRHETRNADTVIYLHIFYEDLIDEFAESFAAAGDRHSFDLVVSIPDTWTIEAGEKLIQRLAPFRLYAFENRGRDIWPFYQSFRATEHLGYTLGCKIHSKKSLHLASGAQWRRDLLNGLIGEQAFAAVEKTFKRTKVGLAAPQGAFFNASDAAAIRDNLEKISIILEKAGYVDAKLVDFVAGSMFWFRPAAMRSVALLPIKAEDFAIELGAIDGTLAHAFERVIPTLISLAGFEIAIYETDHQNLTPYPQEDLGVK